MELSVKNIFNESLALIKSDWAFFIIAFQIVIGIGMLSNNLLSGPLIVGFYACIMKRLTLQNSTYEDIFNSGFQKFLPAFFAPMLMGLASIFGCLALIIGGLVVALLLQFTLPIIADEDDPKIIESMKQSARLVKDNAGIVILVLLSYIGINFLGCLPCFLGLIVTAPLGQIMIVVLFAHLKTGVADPIFKAPISNNNG